MRAQVTHRQARHDRADRLALGTSARSQFVYALKGWVDHRNSRMGATHPGEGPASRSTSRGGLKHNEIATSDDFEILEVSVPGREWAPSPAIRQAGFQKR